MNIMGTSLDPLLFWKADGSPRKALNFATSTLAAFVRGGAGAFVGRLGPRPERRLVLYEMESCPHSRKVREALSMLDLDADIRPCPRGGRVHRQELERAVHVDAKVPVLIDPNTGDVLTESDAIVQHLFRQYGDGPVPALLRRNPLADLTSMAASSLRGHAAMHAAPAKRPELPLHLYSYEASPYCRVVREVLGRLEIPYIVENRARNSPRREAFVAEAGKLQFPYLVDPNTGTRLFESDAIVSYLETTYGAAAEERAEPAARPSPVEAAAE